jgi:hypothetical protein
MALFAVLGLGLETLFTAALDWQDDPKRHLRGHSSLWYLPLYATAPLILKALLPRIDAWAWPVRGLIYMVLLFALEYVSMGALRLLLGESPSEKSYYTRHWNIHGLVRLDFAPAWFVAGLLLEWVYTHVVIL